MDAIKINEDIKKILDEEDKIADLIDKMKYLKGKYFTGTYLKDGISYAPVYDDEFNDAKEDDASLYADYTQDNIDIEFSEKDEEAWVKWAKWINNHDEVVGQGYKFADYVKGGDLDDYEVSKRRKESPELTSSLFITLYINPDEFDGDFEKVAIDIDKYVLDCKRKHDELLK